MSPKGRPKCSLLQAKVWVSETVPTHCWAHRGSTSVFVVENTLPAFIAAVDAGADGVELDVRRTADGALVVHHDPAVAGDDRPIARRPRAELPAHVPDLAAVLDACRGLTVNVEIKNLPIEPDFDPDDAVARQTAELLAARRAEGTEDRIVISSFFLPTLDRVRVIAPDVEVAWLAPSGFDLARAAGDAAARGLHGIHPHHTSVDEAGVAAAAEVGLAVRTWTVNDAAEVRRVAALGVAAVITDDVAMAQATLAR